MDQQVIENTKSYKKKERIYRGAGIALMALAIAALAICRLAGLKDGMPAMTVIYFVFAALFLCAIGISLWASRYSNKCSEIMWYVGAEYIARQLKDTNFLTGQIAHIEFCYKADELTDEQFDNLTEEELKKLDEEESIAVIKCSESGVRLEIDIKPIWDLPKQLGNKKGIFIVDITLVLQYFEAKCYLAASSGKMPVEVTFDDGLSKKPTYIVANGQLVKFKTEKNIFIKYKLL